MNRMTRHKTAAEFAADEIKRRIVEQDLPPGTKIDQTVIAETLGLSRIPVRQALADLARRGFIEMQAHRSAVVASLSQSDLEHLYALRSYLEAWAIEDMVSRFREKECAFLDQLAESMTAAARVDDLARYMEINREFHFFLFSATENLHLRRMLESMFDLTERYQWMCLNVTKNLNQSIQDHRALIAGLRKKDAAATRKVLAQHGRKTVKWILENAVGTGTADARNQQMDST